MGHRSYPIPEHRKEIYDFYRLAFDEDGCPVKDLGDGKQAFHPILPPYLVTDYVLMFQKTGDESYLQYAEEIADISLTKSSTMQDAIVFMYLPESGISTVPTSFYSALTQAWYIKALCLLSKYRPGKYRQDIKKLFNSLMLPIEDGGVLIKKDYGWIVEEYPFEPAFFTLNGWLTVLRWIVQSRNILDEYQVDYTQFLDENFDAVEKLLPLYDAPFCLNSRYQLTGFSRIKIVFSKPAECSCREFGISIPGEGYFEGGLERKSTKSRWELFLERKEPRILQFNVVLSLISKPELNVFKALINVEKPCEAKIYLAQGEYRPDSTGMPTESWKEISIQSLQAGDNRIAVDIPFDDVDMFAYPTNFKKKIGGVMYNGYHFVHIVDLAELYRFCKRDIFKEFTLKWLDYYKSWPELSCLENGYSLEHYLYKTGFEDYIQRNFFGSDT